MKNVIAFGPVPSRRLGRSLGINIIPPKICTYSCVYCQLGKTLHKWINRSSFYKLEEILRIVTEKIEKTKERGESIDYLAFVPDGEPTLDINLGREIELLKSLGLRIAVITNASLLWDEKVRYDLCSADWVSLKIDGFSSTVWRNMNNPQGGLNHHIVLRGIENFARIYTGELVTETMLIEGINDDLKELSQLADFIAQIQPSKAYLSIPTRPPAVKLANAASEKSVNEAYQIFAERSLNAEYLIGYEGNTFAATGNAEADLLSITAVHPMREDSVRELLSKCNEDWEVIEELIQRGELTRTRYRGSCYYLRRFPQERRTRKNGMRIP